MQEEIDPKITKTRNISEMDEIVFFDVETTAPAADGRRLWLLEFGAILVCPRKLVEVDSYCTMIRPADLSVVSPKRFSGLTREVVAAAPTFEEVADRIFDILNGRVWAGHNIQRFDCHRIKEAFADIGRPPPEPKGLIDSLSILTHGFGRRAGDLKMATLASYFGLGQQKHRSLADVRMNLEVLKNCATVLLLESSLPQVYPNRSLGSQGMITRSRANGRQSCGVDEACRKSPPAASVGSHRTSPYKKDKLGKVVERAKEALRSARGTTPLNTLLRHSRTLLR
ncbi:protein NEN4 [Canna indica]|uniref:Protein NEN4 n=1 Tax=Canna indica TaxID=4628 RepID=A0AAQ3KH71_9LILI|nr:protein NEN4 [Canna indica]